jgi:predicted nucleotide-binding protein
METDAGSTVPHALIRICCDRPACQHWGVARRTQSAEPPPEDPALKGTRSRAKELLDRARAEASELITRAADVNDPESYEAWTHVVERWEARTKMALQSIFAGPWPDEFENAATGRIFRNVGQSEDETFLYRQEAIRRGMHELTSIEERMEFLEEPGVGADARPATSGGRQVFIVHGHDRELRERVARLLDRLDLDAIILEEQPDGGRTIIEKFEDHALDVGYAVAVLSPDDVGAAASDAVPSHPNRARQNVLLELGYFMGTLGRSRVAALCSEEVERPSDIHGLLYIDVSQDERDIRLAREMAAAGLPVDLNRLL